MKKDKSYNRLPHFWAKFAMRLIPCMAIAFAICAFGIPAAEAACGDFAALALKGTSLAPALPSDSQIAAAAAAAAIAFAALGTLGDMRAFHSGTWRGEKPSRNASYGSARLASRPRELKWNFDVWRPGQAPRPGIVVGTLGGDGRRLLIDAGESHKLLLGGTGSGKTTSCLLPSQIALNRAGASTFTLDPKGEISSVCWRALEGSGAKLVLIDFSNPAASDGWLPLQAAIDCAKGANGRTRREIADELKTLAGVLIPDRRESSPIWAQAARIMFCGLAGFVASSDAVPDECRNLSTVAVLASMPQGIVQEIVEKLPQGSSSRIALSAVAYAPEDTYGGFATNLNAALETFASPYVSPMLARSDFRPEDFLEGQTHVFVKYNSATEAYHPLIAAFLETTIASLRRLAENDCGGALPTPVHFLLEELPQLPKISLGKTMAICRSQNMFFTCCMQSRAQLKAMYREDAQGIFDNMSTTLLLKGSDQETNRHYSDLLGSYTVETTTRTRGSGGAASSSTSCHEAKLFRPEDLAAWGYQAGHLVIRDGKPFACGCLPISRTFVGDEIGLGGREADAAKQAEMAPCRPPKNLRAAPMWAPEIREFKSVVNGIAEAIAETDDPMLM